MDIKNLRYIVFLLSPEIGNDMKDMQKHDGYVFCSLKDAREYAQESIKEHLCSRFVIGMFEWDADRQMMYISKVETFGFRHDHKQITQLSLFSEPKKSIL